MICHVWVCWHSSTPATLLSLAVEGTGRVCVVVKYFMLNCKNSLFHVDRKSCTARPFSERMPGVGCRCLRNISGGYGVQSWFSQIQICSVLIS